MNSFSFDLSLLKSSKHVTRKPFVIGDFRVSIQTGEGIYCAPRDYIGPWNKVELGFPTEAPPIEIMAYCEDNDRPTETVYGYVPVESVVNWLVSKGATKEQLEDFGFQETTDGIVLNQAPLHWQVNFRNSVRSM